MTQRRKKLNVPLIKAVVMFPLGIIIAGFGALSGIGTQIASASTLEFMLGLLPERLAGTSVVFGLVTAACGAIGAGFGGLSVDTGRAVVLAIAATVGALLSARMAADPRMKLVQRAALTLAMFLAVYTLGFAVRSGPLGPPHFATSFFTGYGGWAAMGLGVGILSALFQIPSGVLLIPALLFLGWLSPAHAIASGLVVAAVASIVPAMVHSTSGHLAGGAAGWMVVGGVLGGLLGGFILARLGPSSPIPLIVFGIAGAYLCARQIWHLGVRGDV